MAWRLDIERFHIIFQNMIRKILRVLRRENLLSLFGVVMGMILISGGAIAWFEPNIDFLNGLWWSVVTMTTVGYGDISPTTPGGRVVATIIMFFGIGLLGMLSANLAALFVRQRMKEDKGMCSMNLKDHIIICEWNHRARAVLRELRADPKTAETPVVLIADLTEKPLDDDLLFFVRGEVCEETLERANLKEAATVVILGDDKLSVTARDAKVVLTTLTIETINPRAYTVVELADEANRRHCERANADEIIVGSEISSHLVASAAIDHGISRVVSELLSSRYGNELYVVKVPRSLTGKKYVEVLLEMKWRYKATLLGLRRGPDAEIMANPDGDTIVEEQDRLVVVAPKRPEITD